MVNVDVSPSVILGVGLIGAGVSLWQIRQARPWISKDYDVVISCISLLVGGILIFQGWRLDPLLLFGQLMTTGAAVSFAVEALRLRSEVYEQEEKTALRDVFKRKGPAGPGGQGGAAFQLPPPETGGQGAWGRALDARRWGADEYQGAEAPEFYEYEAEEQPAGSGAYASGSRRRQQGYDTAGYYYDDAAPADAGRYDSQQYDEGGGGYEVQGGGAPYVDADAYEESQGYYSSSSDGSAMAASYGGGAPAEEFTFPAVSFEDAAPAGGGFDSGGDLGGGEDWE